MKVTINKLVRDPAHDSFCFLIRGAFKVLILKGAGGIPDFCMADADAF